MNESAIEHSTLGRVAPARKRRIEELKQELRRLKAKNIGGKPTVFQGKSVKLTVTLSRVGLAALDAQMTKRGYRSRSDASEYVLRKLTGRPYAGTIDAPHEPPKDWKRAVVRDDDGRGFKAIFKGKDQKFCIKLTAVGFEALVELKTARELPSWSDTIEYGARKLAGRSLAALTARGRAGDHA